MLNMISSTEFYKMIHKASKKYMKLIYSPCIIFYVGTRKLIIDIKPRNFPHLIGISSSGTLNNYGLYVDKISSSSHQLFYDIYENKCKLDIINTLPKKITKKSYIYKKIEAMTYIIDFFRTPDEIVLIEVDETELFDTNVLNKGKFRLYNFKYGISYTLGQRNSMKYFLKSCTKFQNKKIINSYIKNTKVFPIDKIIIRKKSINRGLNIDEIERDLKSITNSICYNFVSNPYDVYSIDELKRIGDIE